MGNVIVAIGNRKANDDVHLIHDRAYPAGIKRYSREGDNEMKLPEQAWVAFCTITGIDRLFTTKDGVVVIAAHTLQEVLPDKAVLSSMESPELSGEYTIDAVWRWLHHWATWAMRVCADPVMMVIQ